MSYKSRTQTRGFLRRKLQRLQLFLQDVRGQIQVVLVDPTLNEPSSERTIVRAPLRRAWRRLPLILLVRLSRRFFSTPKISEPGKTLFVPHGAAYRRGLSSSSIVKGLELFCGILISAPIGSLHVSWTGQNLSNISPNETR